MVKMAAKLTFGLGATDWQERINVARLRDERAERARQVMRKHGIPALLVSRDDNCRYLTGLRGPEFSAQLWYVLFFAEHDPVVFHTAGWLEMMPPEAPWIKHWRLARAWLGGIGGPESVAEESRRFAAGIHKELQERGLAEKNWAWCRSTGPAREPSPPWVSRPWTSGPRCSRRGPSRPSTRSTA